MVKMYSIGVSKHFLNLFAIVAADETLSEARSIIGYDDMSLY
jgi:hypothetical protein